MLARNPVERYLLNHWDALLEEATENIRLRWQGAAEPLKAGESLKEKFVRLVGEEMGRLARERYSGQRNEGAS